MSQEAFEHDANRVFPGSSGPPTSRPPARRTPVRRGWVGCIAALGAILLLSNMWWPTWDGHGTRGTSCEEHRSFLASPEVPDDYRRGSLKTLFLELQRNEEAIERASEEPGIVGDEARYYLKVLAEHRARKR